MNDLKQNENMKRIAVIGAGDAAKRFIKTIIDSNYKNNFSFTAIFDDNFDKIGHEIEGIEVLDSIRNIKKYLNMFDEIVIAIPSSTKKEFNNIYDILSETNKRILTIPSLKEILNHPDTISSVRDINMKDLINRDEMEIHLDKINNSIDGKKILVTGGGGSIGSVIVELCLSGRAKEVICVDNSEYNIYKLEQNFSDERLKTYVSDIKDYQMMDYFFSTYGPDIVFHAAALKHVNIQEKNIRDCLLTNVFGTNNILKLSIKYNTSNFVLISTDKAVEPSNYMGLSKRIAEILVEFHSSQANVKMSSVRFGNVIGSSGSVLNHFTSLIKNKKDIVVTHPKVSRFFMSIKEACYLVLLSIQNSENKHQVFMLDMGEEILIKDIAEKLIQLNGLVVDKDIKILYSQLEKGEKLSEKLNYEFEQSFDTEVSKLIRLDSNKKIEEYKIHDFMKDLSNLVYSKKASNDEIAKFINEVMKGLV